VGFTLTEKRGAHLLARSGGRDRKETEEGIEESGKVAGASSGKKTVILVSRELSEKRGEFAKGGSHSEKGKKKEYRRKSWRKKRGKWGGARVVFGEKKGHETQVS